VIAEGVLPDLELNNYLLKQETSVMIDQDAVLNAIMLANQIDDTFVVFINNPEEDVSSWNDLLTNFKDKNEEKANRGKENSVF
jgi:hypothetical protein